MLIAIGVMIGAMSGFFGIGGGMILVPILLTIGFAIKDAIGISIMQMVFSSLFGSYLNYKKGSLQFNEGIFVGLGGFVGGYIAGFVTPYVSDKVLAYLFLALLLFAIAKLLFSTSNTQGANEVKELPKALLFTIGVGIGIFSIMLGVGGAILLTPILVGFLHYPIKKAVSAGLFFVVFSSIAGLIGRVLHSSIALEPALQVAVASLFGVAIGIRLKERVNNRHHKFALIVLYLVALAILTKKLLAL